jgi:hypothetical protein
MKTHQNALHKHPKFIEALGTLEKLRGALIAEQQVETKLAEHLAMLTIAPTQIDDVATALNLADGNAAPAGNESLTNAISASRGKQSVLQSGIDRQQQRVIDLGGQLSHEHCLAKRGEHVEIAGRILAALGALREAIEAEGKLRESIKDSGFRDLLPGLHRFTFEGGSVEAEAAKEVAHFVALNSQILSATRVVKAVSLRDFQAYGITGKAGEALSVDEITAEHLRHGGFIDPRGKVVKKSSAAQLTELILS